MKFNSNVVLLRGLSVFCIALILPLGMPLWAFQDQGQQPLQAEARVMPPEQLDSLVSQIALYADPLIAQVLAAATYPLEVVEASRWLQANPNLRGTELTDAAREQAWDPSVQALVVFPTVIQMMDRNLRWTTDLGNAFLAQEQDVMDAIQRQRQRAASSGRLVSNEQQRIETSYEDNRNVIAIQPSQPDIIYVPVYDPVSIWGPPIYNPYPPFWYPPRPVYGAVIAGGAFGFFVGVAMTNQFHYWGGWNSWGWNPGWRNRTVIINNNFYVRNNYRPPNNYLRNGNSVWEHNPQHREGVPYPNRAVSDRVGGSYSRDRRSTAQPSGDFRPGQQPYRDTRPNQQSAPQSQPIPQTNRDDRRVQQQPAREAIPSQQPSHEPHASPQPDRSRDRSAFGSVGNGERTRIESDRGYSSLGNRGVSSRPAPAAPTAQPSAQPRSEPRGQSRPEGRSEQPRTRDTGRGK